MPCFASIETSKSITRRNRMLGQRALHRQGLLPTSRSFPRHTRAAIRARQVKFGKEASLRSGAKWSKLVTSYSRPGRRSAVVCTAIFEKFTENSIKAVMLTQHEAKALGKSEAEPVHLLLGLLRQDTRECAAMLGGSATLERTRKAVQMQTGTHRREVVGASTEVVFSTEAKRVFESAQQEAERQRQKFVSPVHLLHAILCCGNTNLRAVLTSLGVNLRAAKAAAQEKLDGEKEAEGVKQVAFAGRSSSSKKTGGKGTSKALESFCRDLCAEARLGRLDPVVGRDEEVARVTQILARRSKNNPVLLGEPGTGKTAIAEGLARSIVSGQDHRGRDIPGFLRSKRVLQLDIGLLISGSKERGELEKRVTGILDECLQAGDVILVIDEIHTIVGTGAVGRTSGAGGSGLDLGNLLKPALARGRLQVVGATTIKEHRQYFEKDPALERRFQPVLVAEPTSLDALAILKGLQERYERHHNCIFSPQALVAAVSLSERYVPDRFLPDKAIDLMDEAGSRARIANYLARKSSGAQLAVAEAGPSLELLQVMEAKTISIQEGLWEEAELLRSRELDLKRRLSTPSSGSPAAAMPVVDASDVADIVASWTGIPVSQLSQDDCWKLLNLAADLKEVVIGQDAAVDSLSHAITRARSGLGDPSRPVASLLFQGPTGVGKTELARSLAKLYFGSATALVRLDMSEYGERHSVSKLVGAPPGFMGYGAQGGVLTEAVRRHPHCLLLLDEVEKAHPDVFNILLQVLEDGRLTDSSGRVANFKHSLIVMTTNLGGGAGKKSMAFDLHTGAGGDDSEQERVRAAVNDELKAYFRPEFLNRLDEVIIFRTLRMEEVRLIADLMLSQTSARLLEARGFSLQISGRLMSHLLEAGYDEEYGARPLRRAITQLIEDPLADAILGGRLQKGQVAFLDFDGTAVSVAAKQRDVPDVVLQSGIVAKPAAGAVKRVKHGAKVRV